MPAIKYRLAVRAPNFIATSGLYRDLIIPYAQIIPAASGIITAGSLNVNSPTGSGPTYLQFNSTSSGCAVTLQIPIPQDIALSTPAAASGQIIFDWLNASGNGKVVTIAACLGYVPSGSEWTIGGTCVLMSAACATMTAASALALNSTSLAQFNVPTSRNGNFVLRFGVKSQDAANTSGSDFHLSSIRLRYLSDRLGS
jgi:hypothetical protein